MVAQLREVERLFPNSRLTIEGGDAYFYVNHRGFRIRPVFAPDHPYEPPHIYLSPEPSSSHYYVHSGERYKRLCWCMPSDCFPQMHVLVAVTAAMRFINEYRAGGAR